MGSNEPLDNFWHSQEALPKMDENLTEEHGKVGRYNILWDLGQGEFGKVRACHFRDPDKASGKSGIEYALKSINKKNVRRRQQRRVMTTTTKAATLTMLSCCSPLHRDRCPHTQCLVVVPGVPSLRTRHVRSARCSPTYAGTLILPRPHDKTVPRGMDGWRGGRATIAQVTAKRDVRRAIRAVTRIGLEVRSVVHA
jgi:hypothetical protein